MFYACFKIIRFNVSVRFYSVMNTCTLTHSRDTRTDLVCLFSLFQMVENELSKDLELNEPYYFGY